MSFRKNGKKLKVVRLADNHDGIVVQPTKGTNTLYWWNKGDDPNGWHVKADLYNVEGENAECLIADTFTALIAQIKGNYGFDI